MVSEVIDAKYNMGLMNIADNGWESYYQDSVNGSQWEYIVRSIGLWQMEAGKENFQVEKKTKKQNNT